MGMAKLAQGRTLPAEQWEHRHRGMLILLWVHVAGLPVVALLYGMGPGESLLAGGLIALFAIAATLVRRPARRARALLVALGLLTCSAVLVHVTGGLIEAHFHFFVVVAVLSLYEDWVPFGVAVGYVLLQHGLMAVATPDEHVFNHSGPAWKWSLVHSAFIGALCVALVVNWRTVERERLATAEAEERQRSVLESLQDGVVVYDEGERIVYVNPAAEEILGVPRAELAGGTR